MSAAIAAAPKRPAPAHKIMSAHEVPPPLFAVDVDVSVLEFYIYVFTVDPLLAVLFIMLLLDELFAATFVVLAAVVADAF